MVVPLTVLLLLAASATATFFNGGCGCPPPPLCLPPPPPLCLPQIQLPQIQLPQLPSPCCPTCACGRKKREVSLNSDEDTEIKEETCNDSRLLEIMQKNMDGDAKRVKLRLVQAAEKQLGGHYTVICSKSTFSFVTSTTNYCLHSQNHLNCYLFKTE
ncbi:unnamed protein product [Caenorhabditis auriculariae]|uniref:Ground-like domain-containing protein n=1 Tax=Caenorhabditis auriculariae TaxID=2777116 RepID=A0A8S1HPG7_9PELO|nr:unnamed protein product [Caenorhabditis auriculariae]